MVRSPRLLVAFAVAACTADPAPAPAPPHDLVNLDLIWVSHSAVQSDASPFHQPAAARTAADAHAIADAARGRVLADPGAFAEVAATTSDDVFSRQTGGAMGMVSVRDLPPELADAIARLRPFAVSPVLDTPSGVYVVRRRPDAPDVRLSAAVIFVTWTGADSLIPPVTPRTKLEALALARAARAAAVVAPDQFTVLVRAVTDDRERVLQDGWEGVWSSVADPIEELPFFTQATLALQIGDVSPVLEGVDGFYVVRRLAAVEPPTFTATELVISYAAARFAGDGPRPVTRDRAAAQALADRTAAELRADPKSFDRRVAELSDSPTAASGGKRTWTKGRLLPELDRAVEPATPGTVVGPIGTPNGFVILRRDP